MSYYLLRPTQLVRYKTRKKGFEQLASISLSLGCGASIINYSPRFLMTMFYYLVLLSTEKSSPHGCICPIFWVPDLLGQSFPPRKQDSETSPFRLFHSPAFAPLQSWSRPATCWAGKYPPSGGKPHAHLCQDPLRILNFLHLRRAAVFLEGYSAKYYPLNSHLTLLFGSKPFSHTIIFRWRAKL